MVAGIITAAVLLAIAFTAAAAGIHEAGKHQDSERH